MKFLLPLFLLVLFSCSTTKALKNYTSEGYNMSGLYIIYNETDTVARLTSMELSLDDGKLVHEVTFTLIGNDMNHKAGDIIKTVHEKKPEWEIEVEVDYSHFISK